MKIEKLSLIIPVYNEEKTIEKVLNEILKIKYPIKREIIIVDDCSKDKTLKIINKIAKTNKEIIIKKHEKNSGKGSAIRTGLNASKGTIIGIQDADREYNPEEHLKLIKPIIQKKEKIVYGSRFLGKKKIQGKTLFYLGNKFLSFLTSLLYGQKITDMETCYKFYKKECLKNIQLKGQGFEIEPEITAKFLKRGFKIKEIPIKYNPRSTDEGKKIKIIDGLTAVWILFKERLLF
ncbi:MAG: glycosyltransferase family 2 protein [Nanoarchaeota archaeon]